jgi:hypothetical protein
MIFAVFSKILQKYGLFPSWKVGAPFLPQSDQKLKFIGTLKTRLCEVLITLSGICIWYYLQSFWRFKAHSVVGCKKGITYFCRISILAV